MNIEVVPMQENDWPQVQRLLETTPMTASIPLAAARPNQPKVAYPAIHGESLDLVAKQGGKVVGFVHGRVEEKMAYENGEFKEVKSVYLGDFRVDKNCRRQGLASKLATSVSQLIKDMGIDYGWGVVIAKNAPMIKFYNKIADQVIPVREYTVASRFIWSRPKKQKNPSYEQFKPTDENFKILSDKLAKRFLGPKVSVEDLSHLVQTYPEIRFYRRKAGDGEIAFALWDQSKFRQLLLTSLPLHLRLIRWFWNFMAFFTGAHSFPKAGHPWRSTEVTLVAEDEFSKDIEQFIVSEAFEMGAHTVNIIEKGLGGSQATVKFKGPGYRMNLKLMSYGVKGQAPLTSPDSVYADVDLGFV